jgi:hypothetical protein
MPDMTRRTVYCVQTYSHRACVLVASQIERFRSETEATRQANYLRPRVSGGVIFSQEVDPEFDVLGEPCLLAAYGELPEGARLGVGTAG